MKESKVIRIFFEYGKSAPSFELDNDEIKRPRYKYNEAGVLIEIAWFTDDEVSKLNEG